jgi:hypothetical protein
MGAVGVGRYVGEVGATGDGKFRVGVTVATFNTSHSPLPNPAR